MVRRGVSIKMRAPSSGAIVSPEDRIRAKQVLEGGGEHGKLSAIEPVPCLMLHPESRFRSAWNGLVLLLLVHTAVVVPFQVSFYQIDPPALFVLQIVVDSLWFMDILITFRTAYYDKATLVSSPGTVARRYLTSWFLLDMIATFPVYAFSEQEAATKLSRVVRLPRLFKVVRILRLVRVLRLQRFSAYVHHIEAIFSSNVALLRLVKFACVTIIMQHWISCGWFLMADLGAFAPETWVFRRFCGPFAERACTGFGSGNATLLDMFGCTPEQRGVVAVECATVAFDDTSTVYLDGFYFALSALTTVGFGDVSAYTNLERVFAIIVMLIGVSLYAFAVGNLSSMLSNIDSEKATLRKRLSALNEFARANRLPPPLRAKLRNYFTFSSSQRKLTKQQRTLIMSELPPSLRYLVLFHTHSKMIGAIHFLALKDPALVCEIVTNLVPSHFEPGDALFAEEDFAAETFFLISGTVVISKEVDHEVEATVEVLDGDCLGQEAALYQHYEATARAVTACELQGLMRETIRKLSVDFPSFIVDMRNEYRHRAQKLREDAAARKEALSTGDSSSSVTSTQKSGKLGFRADTLLDKWKTVSKHVKKTRTERLRERSRDMEQRIDTMLQNQRAILERLNALQEAVKAQ